MGYSVAIRTLGRAGAKYQKLLDSIKNSKVQPEKVIVVLPEGYAEPKEQLGYEQFVYCRKSMIQQRIEALKYISSEYTLFVDDDVAFDETFIEKLMEPLDKKLFDCSTGPLFSFFPASKAGKIMGTLTASVSVSIFRRNMYVKILRSGGWSYHTFDTTKKHFYPTESFAWTCFMIRTEVMREIKMEDEILWLEKYGYAAGDDKVMAYKLVKKGYKACIVSNALYQHNDARTSTSESEMINTLPTFCMYYMLIVFWHRFIQKDEKSRFHRLQNRICFSYWQLTIGIYQRIKWLNPSYRPKWKAYREGMKAGKSFVSTKEFFDLPPIVK